METVIDSFSEAATLEIGMRLGREAGPGMVYALVGDLGTGKTILAKGMALGLGISRDIVSPTFTIVQEYHEGRLPFYHFDIYRIEDEDELFEIGFDEYLSSEGVCLVEWADQVTEAMPPETVWIRIQKDLSKGTEYRAIVIGDELN
ncbi:MAG: tRNA (adenosine(37)-N6)-threonylcarbamoyltransferase complex ATPase subunit type 1 TsaE [Lachnospiraceae bacterium]|nr:tRNA (adenosine(37)-N6)-threonylcarbamoyltransferase complex ATPase subunit type 1 TsaE [Lachnospiraceae bacterium]